MGQSFARGLQKHFYIRQAISEIPEEGAHLPSSQLVTVSHWHNEFFVMPPQIRIESHTALA